MKKQSKLNDTSFYIYFLSAITHPKNFFFCLRFPFIRMKNVWTDRFSGYKYTMLDDLSIGWKKAFGKQLCKDIKIALKEDNIKRKNWQSAIKWEQIKSKYGRLCLYATTTEKVSHVLAKYEHLSICYCECCGKPARYVTDNWVAYLCPDCFKQEILAKDAQGRYLYNESYRKNCLIKNRLSEKDIPKARHYSIARKQDIEIDFKQEYGIDFSKLWGLKE